MGILLGTLKLFYPLLIASFTLFIYALIKRSWILMLISTILLYPNAWYLSGTPRFPWAIVIPLFQVILAILFYFKKKYHVKLIES